jgi:hypothetical protein
MRDDDDGPRQLSAARFLALIPSWAQKVAALDEASGAAWDERVRRMNAGVATDEDLRIHALAERALQTGERMPSEARRMPLQPPLSKRQSTWRPAELDTVERAMGAGVPPLIAERIIEGRVRDTRSTRACRRVGRDYTILVLIGDRGCGKSYAAADWLWSARHAVPYGLERKVTARRFIEAPALAAVEFADRPALGLAAGLAIDDAGTEKDFLIAEWADIFIARYKNKLATVITTNMNQADFCDRYGGRFADRMKEVGAFRVVSNSPEDSLRGRNLDDDDD